MTRVLASAMAITMALALFLGVFFYGGTDADAAVSMYLIGLLGAILWAVKLLASGAATWKRSPMHWPVLAFAAYAAVRYFTSPVEYDARIEVLHIALCVLAYFTACQFYRPTDRLILFVTLAALIFLQVVLGFLQFSTKSIHEFPPSVFPQWLVELGWMRPEGFRNRGGGFFICPNNFAAFLELALGLILVRGLMMHRRKGSVEAFATQRLVTFYFALMALAGIAISLSRGGWLATLAGLFLLLAWGDWRSRLHWGRIAAVGVAILALGLIIWKLAPTRVLISVTTSDKTGEAVMGPPDWTLNSRTHLWKGTTRMILEKPLVGTGAASWQWLFLKHKPPDVPTHPENVHNEYLNLLSDYGVVGFALVAWVFVGFFRQASRLNNARVPSDERSFAVGATVGVSMVLVHALFDFNFHIPANAFMLALVMGSVAAIEDPEQRFPRAPMPGWARWALGIGLLVVSGFLGWQFNKAAQAVRHTRAGNHAKREYFHIDPGIAVNFYRRAIAADPGYSKAYWKIGDIRRQQAFWRRGDDKKAEREQFARQAVESYAMALRLNPYDTEVLLRAAAADELAGDDNAALQKYLRALEVAPYSSINHESIARFYRDRDKLEEALKHYERAHSFQSYHTPSIYDNIEDLRELLKARQQ